MVVSAHGGNEAMKNLHQPGESVEVSLCPGSFTIDGYTVSVSCFRVEEPYPHYELVLQCGLESGVVDIPDEEEGTIGDRAETAADIFVAAIKLRSQTLP